MLCMKLYSCSLFKESMLNCVHSTAENDFNGYTSVETGPSMSEKISPSLTSEDFFF